MMGSDETHARDRIFQAALALITEGKSEEQITMREIALKAGVNLALVNYYYQSKENLLSQVVGMMMGGIISRVTEESAADTDPREKLKKMMLATADAAFQYRNICRIAIAHELKEGCRNACEMVTPLLREIFIGCGESELAIMALQLMMPFHHIILEPELFGRLLGTDFFDAEKRKNKISQMVDCVVEKGKEVSNG